MGCLFPPCLLLAVQYFLVIGLPTFPDNHDQPTSKRSKPKLTGFQQSLDCKICPSKCTSGRYHMSCTSHPILYSYTASQGSKIYFCEMRYSTLPHFGQDWCVCTTDQHVALLMNKAVQTGSLAVHGVRYRGVRYQHFMIFEVVQSGNPFSKILTVITNIGPMKKCQLTCRVEKVKKNYVVKTLRKQLANCLKQRYCDVYILRSVGTSMTVLMCQVNKYPLSLLHGEQMSASPKLASSSIDLVAFRMAPNILHGYSTLRPGYSKINDAQNLSVTIGHRRKRSQVCSVGFFGTKCNLRCHCSFNRPCHPLTGICENQEACALGWSGPDCSVRECPEGFYGLFNSSHCKEKCICKERGVCNVLNGECRKGLCMGVANQVQCTNQYCVRGHFSPPTCKAKCFCYGQLICHSETGECPIFRCKKGFVPPTCEMPASTFFGLNTYIALFLFNSGIFLKVGIMMKFR